MIADRLFNRFVFLNAVFIGLGRSGSRRPLRTWRSSRRRPIPVRLPRTVAVLGRTRSLPILGRAWCLPVRRLPIQSAVLAGRIPRRGVPAASIPGPGRSLRRRPVPGRSRRSTVPSRRTAGPRRRTIARGRRTVARGRRSCRGQARLHGRLPAIPVRIHSPRLADR